MKRLKRPTEAEMTTFRNRHRESRDGLADPGQTVTLRRTGEKYTVVSHRAVGHLVYCVDAEGNEVKLWPGDTVELPYYNWEAGR